jgi:hypothetical protein
MKMRLALLAPHDAGKTCYLSALYGECRRFLIRPREAAPLTFAFTNSSQDAELHSNYRKLLRGEMPFGTENIHTYPVRIVHQDHNTSTDIELVDFPGRLIEDSPDGPAKAKLTDLLATCDGFIILIDATKAALSEYRFVEEIAAARINEILRDVMARKRGGRFALHGIPFFFAISKVDLINENTDLLQKTYHNVMNTFPEIFRDDASCIAGITQITLGKNINGALADQEREYRPKNILLPFFLTFGIGALSGARFCHAERDRLESARKDAWEHYCREKGYADRAHNALRRREQADFFGKIDQFLESGDFKGELAARAARYKADEQGAENKYIEVMNQHVAELDRIRVLRTFGATALRELRWVEFGNGLKAPDAVIYMKGRRHTVRCDVASETEMPLEVIKNERMGRSA